MAVQGKHRLRKRGQPWAWETQQAPCLLQMVGLAQKRLLKPVLHWVRAIQAALFQLETAERGLQAHQRQGKIWALHRKDWERLRLCIPIPLAALHQAHRIHSDYLSELPMEQRPLMVMHQFMSVMLRRALHPFHMFLLPTPRPEATGMATMER